MFNDLKSLKDTYQTMKKKGKEERLLFLDSIVSYCEFLKFNKDKTMMMLALTRNFLPEPGQSFTNCDLPDEIDIEYNKKMLGIDKE